MKKTERKIVIGLLLISIISMFSYYAYINFSSHDQLYVEITKENEVLTIYELNNEDQFDLFVEGEHYSNEEIIEKLNIEQLDDITMEILEEEFNTGEEINLVVARNNEVKMYEANCPDKTCVETTPIYRAGEMIVCAPHSFYVKIIGETKLDVS